MRSRRTIPTGPTGGFSMVELLVTVVILGVIAAIAVPIFMNQKAKAYLAIEQSNTDDLRTVIGTVTLGHAGQAFPATGAALKTLIENEGFRVGAGNAIDLYPNCAMPAGTPVVSTGNYVIRGFRNAGANWTSYPYYVYDSSTGNRDAAGFSTIASSVCSPTVVQWRG
jgi:prepilin-type N-terminal cleavage/methylation domain-containing protein